MPDTRTILVTGAGGFIGGRVVELMHQTGFAHVRAGVRRWSSAARIGRLPVEMVLCDLRDPAQVASAMAGVDAVVHCAVGDRENTVEGTAAVLAAARAAGVRRVVHISTIDVYGPVEGDTPEDRPLTRTGAAYGDMKIEAEELCRRHMAEGLPVVILRPTIVYGPFSASWTVEFAERLQVRPWPFPPELCAGVCNLVYVDDLVHAIMLAVDHPAAAGEAFNVNGDDRPTWFEYFTALNAALGLPPIEAKTPTGSRFAALAMQPVRATAKLALKHFQRPIMHLYQNSDAARVVMKFAEGMIRRAPTSGEFRLYGRRGTFPTAKAERLLGYRPRVSMAEGVALSAAWVRHSGLLRTGDQA